jgi:hypothetical protein
MRTVQLPNTLGTPTTLTIDADGVVTVRAALPGPGPLRFGPVAVAVVRDGAALPVEGRPEYGAERWRALLAAELGLRLPFHPGGDLDPASVSLPTGGGAVLGVLRQTGRLVVVGIPGRGDDCLGRLDEAGRLIPNSGNPALWGLAARLVKLGTVEAAS